MYASQILFIVIYLHISPATLTHRGISPPYFPDEASLFSSYLINTFWSVDEERQADQRYLYVFTVRASKSLNGETKNEIDLYIADRLKHSNFFSSFLQLHRNFFEICLKMNINKSTGDVQWLHYET